MEQQHTEPEAERRPQPDIHITVNGRPVTVHRHQVTGLEIKEAAIAQGVHIQIDFVLSEDRHGHPRIIGDHDVVTVHDGSKFLAVAPDDNS